MFRFTKFAKLCVVFNFILYSLKLRLGNCGNVKFVKPFQFQSPNQFLFHHQYGSLPMQLESNQYSMERNEDSDLEIGKVTSEEGKSMAVDNDSKSASNTVNSSSGEGESNTNNESDLDQTIKELTTPEQIIPIANDLLMMSLVILHLPVIIPTILIPLAFFAVGTFLIPIVRVNYFINHKDDGHDGRSLHNYSTVNDNLLISKLIAPIIGLVIDE